MNARNVNLSWRLMSLAIYSESNNILSFRSYFHSKGDTFFETPGTGSPKKLVSSLRVDCEKGKRLSLNAVHDVALQLFK